MTLVIAHRGASGAAWENSPTAFRLARDLGADGVELDVHATGDGALVVHHDPDVPGIGTIGATTLAALQHHRLPNGEPIPTLAATLALLEGLDVWVEVKALPPRADAELLATLASGPTPARYAVHSFDHRIIRRLRDQAPALRLGALQVARPVDALAAARAAGATTLWQERHLVDAELVGAAHRAGMQVIVWTVDDPAEIARLAALGVDGICGNYPDRIRQAVSRRAPA